MSFDSSRFPFSPWNDFNGVVMQQGRVQLDSDWNEWLAELGRRIRAGTLDTVGRAVYPVALPNSFLITPVSGSITIGVGRMYVDGMLVENHGLTAPATQGWVPGSASSPSGSGATWDGSLDELYINVPVDYDKQPYYPNAPAFPTSPGPFLIYLDVWQREVTFREDPVLIENAVGVDTTGRLQVVWQVKLLDLTNVTVPGGVVCTTQDSDIGPWATLIQPSAGRLTTGVVQSSSSGPCCLAPNTGYTGMENQLYRVEIHQGGSASSGPTATFKWSRDNASVATAVTGIGQAGLVLTVQSTGKDSVLRFSPNDWVEITDDYLEVNGQHGELHQVSLVSDTANTITLSSAVSATSFPANTTTGLTDPSRHTRVVRWDQGGKVFESDGATVWVDLGAAGSTGDIPVPPPGTSLILENGVTVSFDLSPSTGSFQIGDYWAFAARATDGTVESLIEAPPLGIHHHYARLALVTPSGTPSDCRIPWPPSFDEGCDCTVCVTAASHKAGGTGTIQAAINKVLTLTPPGGKICLGPGTYNIAQTVTVSGASNIQITGHGLPILMATNLPGNDPIMLITSESVDITIEDLGFSTAAQPGGAGQSSLRGLIVQDSSFVRVNRCLFAPSPNGSQLSPAIALGGTVSDSSIRGNSFNNVQLGIGLMDEIKTHFLSYISIEYNQMTCTSAGVALAPDDPSSGALALRFANNSIQSAAGFEMLSFNAVDLVVEENTFMIGGSPNGGDGIVCSGDGKIGRA